MSSDNLIHGEYTLSVENSILVATLKGGWNLECAQNFSQCFKEVAKPLLNKPWAHLVYLEDWELGVPEIMPIISELVIWCLENNLEKSAHVYSASMTKEYFLNKMVVTRESTFEKQLFIEEAAAKTWLKIYGFTLTP